MSPNVFLKDVTTVVLICYQVLLVFCDRCLFTLSNGDQEYKYCPNGCCEDDDDDEKHCCEPDNKHVDGMSTATAIGIIVCTLLGFFIFFGLFILLIKSFCFKFKRTQERQVRTPGISLQPVTTTGPNSSQQYAVYTIPSSTDEGKPPPYIPNEPSAPPSYDEVMREISQPADV